MTTKSNQKINHVASHSELSKLQQELRLANQRLAALESRMQDLRMDHNTTRHAAATIGVFLYGSIDNAYAACGRF